MACMEHTCTECDFFTCNNRSMSSCPDCGARLISQFDEYPDGSYEEVGEEAE